MSGGWQPRRADQDAIKRALGQRIREARLEAGLSQAQVGGARFSKAHISSIESGKVYPSIEALIHIGEQVGVPAWSLLSAIAPLVFPLPDDVERSA